MAHEVLLTSGRSNDASVLINGLQELSYDQWNTLYPFHFFLGVSILIFQITLFILNVFFLNVQKIELLL